jgi:hypothetical protein
MLVGDVISDLRGGQMRLIATIGVLAAVVSVSLVPTAAAAPAGAAQVREFEGTVVSKNRAARTFRLRDVEPGTVRIKVTRRTRFERIAGFRGLRRGMRRVEATVQRRNGRWVALEVERSGGGGEHGGDDDRRGGDDD